MYAAHGAECGRGGDIVAFPEGEDFKSGTPTMGGVFLIGAALARPLLLLDVWSATDEGCVATAEIAMDELLRRPEVRYRAEVTDDEDVVVARVRLCARRADRERARHGGDASAATDERDGAMVRSRVLRRRPCRALGYHRHRGTAQLLVVLVFGRDARRPARRPRRALNTRCSPARVRRHLLLRDEILRRCERRS